MREGAQGPPPQSEKGGQKSEEREKRKEIGKKKGKWAKKNEPAKQPIEMYFAKRKVDD